MMQKVFNGVLPPTPAPMTNAGMKATTPVTTLPAANIPTASPLAPADLYAKPQGNACIKCAFDLETNKYSQTEPMVWCAEFKLQCNKNMNNPKCDTVCIRNGARFQVAGAYSNQSFNNLVQSFKKGRVSAMEMSALMTNVPRVPGMQMQACDPTVGGCDVNF